MFDDDQLFDEKVAKKYFDKIKNNNLSFKKLAQELAKQDLVIKKMQTTIDDKTKENMDLALKASDSDIKYRQIKGTLLTVQNLLSQIKS